MKMRFINCLLLFLVTFAVEAGEFQAVFEKEIRERLSQYPEFIEDIRKHKDQNPVFEKLIKEHDEQDKLEKSETKIVIKEPEHTRDFKPSSKIADEALKKGDLETALKHYEALGEDGDSKASMATGFIYAEGAEGIEADRAKAAAWFKRSGDQGSGVAADLYEKMNSRNELNKEDKIKAEKIIHEFQESDSKLTKEQQILTTDSFTSGSPSLISKITSQQYVRESEPVQISDTKLTDNEESFSPTQLNSGAYSYLLKKVPPNHYSPERE